MSQRWTHYNPVTVRAGVGQLDCLPSVLSSGLWLLVTTAGTTGRGLTSQIQGVTTGTAWEVYDQVTPNPELDELETVIAHYRQMPLVGVVAVGGGSVIDTAKVLAVTLPESMEQPLDRRLRQCSSHPWLGQLPLIVIPTTSGTGAEVTPFATVWDSKVHQKYSIVGDEVFPKMALLDPELLLSLPFEQTLYTGLDAISHCLESLWNRHQTPVSLAYATQGLRLALKAFPEVLENPDNLQARSQMQEVSLFGGLAISQTRTAIAHSISYPLTSHFGIPHGLACSFTLPNILESYLAIGQDCLDMSLMKDVLQLLRSLDLFTYIHEYATEEQIKNLQPEMFHPERAGNFTGCLSDEVVRDFLSVPR